MDRIIDFYTAESKKLMLKCGSGFSMGISGFFSRDWKRHIGFLVPLAAGMGILLSFCLHSCRHHLSEFLMVALVLLKFGDVKGWSL
jgi:hypothetical protein